MRAPVRAFALGALFAIAPSCIQRNAYLELTLDLPFDENAATTMTAPRYAVVRVNTGDVSFDEDWQSSDAVPPVHLDPKNRASEAISIEGTPDNESKPVRVKVRFCLDPACAGIHDDKAPEIRVEIERAFYIGKRTHLPLKIECIPKVPMETDASTCALVNDSVTQVPKCSVAGCREGVTTSYCANGQHFCEAELGGWRVAVSC